MGKLDGTGGVTAPGGFRDGKRKCPFAASWNISFQAGISSSRTVAWETRNMKEHQNRVGATRGTILGGQCYEPQAALDTGQKVRDGWGGPRFQRGQGRSAHVGRLKEGKKEPRLLEWGWGRPEPHSVQSGGGTQAWAKLHL